MLSSIRVVRYCLSWSWCCLRCTPRSVLSAVLLGRASGRAGEELLGAAGCHVVPVAALPAAGAGETRKDAIDREPRFPRFRLFSADGVLSCPVLPCPFLSCPVRRAD